MRANGGCAKNCALMCTQWEMSTRDMLQRHMQLPWSLLAVCEESSCENSTTHMSHIWVPISVRAHAAALQKIHCACGRITLATGGRTRYTNSCFLFACCNLIKVFRATTKVSLQLRYIIYYKMQLESSELFFSGCYSP